MTAESLPYVCSIEGCERSAGIVVAGARRCCLTCGNESVPDVHLSACEVRNGTHHSQQNDPYQTPDEGRA